MFRLKTVLAAAAAGLLLFGQSAVFASDASDLDIAERVSFNRYGSVSPLDAASMFAPPDVQSRTFMITGGDYISLGNIANISSMNTWVHADGGDYFTTISVRGLQVTGGRQVYNVVTNAATGKTTMNHVAEFARLKLSPRARVINLPHGGRVAIGTAMYRDRSFSPRKEFSQPFAAVGFDYRSLHVSAGANRTYGDFSRMWGYFASAELAVHKGVAVYSSYDRRDFNKLIINKIILPRAGFDCSNCKDDALSAGVAFKAGSMLFANAGMYDIGDLKVPVGSLSVRWQY